MKKLGVLLSTLAVLALILSSVGCGGNQPSSTTTATPTNHGETSALIGPGGGTLEVTEPSSPLFGVKVEIPQGALAEDETVTIHGTQHDPLAPGGFVLAGDGIQLGPEGTFFQYPVSISIPYLGDGIDESTVAVYKYEPNTETWEILLTESVDTSQDVIYVYAFSFSYFYPLAVSDSGKLPNPTQIPFDPDRDGLVTPNVNNCFGDVAFVQWFWGNKRAVEGNLANWYPERHAKIASMAQCTTWPERTVCTGGTKVVWSRQDDGRVATTLVTNLVAFGKPQIVGFAWKDGNDIKYHAILVYNCKATQGMALQIIFDVYDPNGNPTKKQQMTYDGTFLHYGGGNILGFHVIGCVFDTDALNFMYEYIIVGDPIITNKSPTGEIDSARPTISAIIRYPLIYSKRAGDIPIVKMILDGHEVNPVFERIDSNSLKISFTPTSDLLPGEHSVNVSGQSYYSKRNPNEDWCLPPVEDEWHFTVTGGWNFTFNPDPPAVHILAQAIEVEFVSEEYGDTGPHEIDVDVAEIPELSATWQQWVVPFPLAFPMPIKVEKTGGTISASFYFVQQPTGEVIKADLKGAISSDSLDFDINYQLSSGLQNYSFPLNYSDQMSEIEGKVYYSLPGTITVSFQGTMSEDDEGKETIVGTFTENMSGQFARWRFHDQEYSVAIGPYTYGRQEKIFEGTVEWVFSNLRWGGNFQVDIR